MLCRKTKEIVNKTSKDKNNTRNHTKIVYFQKKLFKSFKMQKITLLKNGYSSRVVNIGNVRRLGGQQINRQIY